MYISGFIIAICWSYFSTEQTPCFKHETATFILKLENSTFDIPQVCSIGFFDCHGAWNLKFSQKNPSKDIWSGSVKVYGKTHI